MRRDPLTADLHEIAPMTMEATSPELAARAQVRPYAPEQSLLVACLLSMSGGFLDAFTWLSLGGVFANSQTGNVVFLGMNAALGNWHEAAHHVPPILAFLAGAWVATRLKAPLLCLVGEIIALTAVMLLLHRLLYWHLLLIVHELQRLRRHTTDTFERHRESTVRRRCHVC